MSAALKDESAYSQDLGQKLLQSDKLVKDSRDSAQRLQQQVRWSGPQRGSTATLFDQMGADPSPSAVPVNPCGCRACA